MSVQDDRRLDRDLFVSHAHEDKDAVARPLARALIARGWSVWLDELELTVGDRLGERIDEGLRRSRFGVVVLSPAFFRKQWPRHELTGLAEREADTGTKVILPVHHGVSYDDIRAFSPALADRVAAATDDGIKAVADRISQALVRAGHARRRRGGRGAAASVVCVAGMGERGFAGDGGPAAKARVNAPGALAFDPLDGALYVADRDNHRVRRIDLDTGAIVTVAGTHEQGFAGDGGPATAARLSCPDALALDVAERALYVADAANHRVRRVDLARGTIATVAGGGGIHHKNSPRSARQRFPDGLRGAGRRATTARLGFPRGLALDPDRRLLYVSTPKPARIRCLDLARGTIRTVVGHGRATFELDDVGDDGPAMQAALAYPYDLALDVPGQLLYVADCGTDRVRRLDLANGVVTTVTGGDRPARRGAAREQPKAVAIAPDGRALYVACGDEPLVRRLDLASGELTVVAGPDWPGGGVMEPAGVTVSDWRCGLAFDGAGALYVAAPHRVWRVEPAR